MASQARPDERQPLLGRIDEEHESNNNAKGHYNLAGLSQRHFWILVSYFNPFQDLSQDRRHLGKGGKA
jgi:hypothetical protein